MVKRYDPWDYGMEENLIDGGYVRYGDHAAVASALNSLQNIVLNQNQKLATLEAKANAAALAAGGAQLEVRALEAENKRLREELEHCLKFKAGELCDELIKRSQSS